MCIYSLIIAQKAKTWFLLLNLFFSQNYVKSLWLHKNLENMLYQVLSTSWGERCGGHDALEVIGLKLQKFRFQVLLRQNVANYVFVTVYVLKYVYFHLLSLKTQKRDFWFSEFVSFSELCKQFSDLRKVTKTCCIRCHRRAASNEWQPWCSKPYALQMAKISISNFIAPKCCKLCICNCLCA